MSFITYNSISNYKRKTEDLFSGPSKKNKLSPNSNCNDQKNTSYYSQYLISFATDPSSKDYVRFLTQHAVKQYSEKDLYGAVKTCNEILIRNPNSFLAKKLRGEIYYQQLRFQEAFVDLKQAFQIHPFEFEIDPRFLINNSLKEGDDEAALNMLNYQLRHHPEDISLFFLRAKLYLRKGEYDLIQNDLVKIESHLSDLSVENQIEYNLLEGELHLQTGNWIGAKYSFKNILTIDPSHLVALEKCLFIISQVKRQEDRVNKYLTKIETYHPKVTIWRDFAAARSAFRKAIKKSNDYALFIKAKQFCLQGLKNDPENYALRSLQATVSYHLYCHDEAKQVFLKLLKEYPNDAHVLTYLGFIEFDQGHRDSALQYFNQALKIDESKEEARKKRAEIYFDKQEYQSAHDDYQLLIERNFRSLCFNYGYTLEQLGHLESALDYLYIAFQMDPENKVIRSRIINISKQIARNFSPDKNDQDPIKYLKSLYFLSMIDLKNKQFEKAMKNLDLLLSIAPTYFPARYARSVCLSRIGRSDQAMASFSCSLIDHLQALSDFPFSKEKDTPHCLKKNEIIFLSTEERIMLEAIEKKGVILRPFQFEDIIRIADFYDPLLEIPFFSIYTLKELNEIASKNNPSNVEIVSLQVPHSTKIKGCAIFNISTSFEEEKKVCFIRAIHIADKYQKMGLGSLLLNYAVHQAIKKECASVKLDSTQDGLPLYFSYGFKPEDLEPVKLQKWEQCDSKGKINFFAGHSNVKLKLNIHDPAILENLKQKLQQTLSQPAIFKKRKS